MVELIDHMGDDLTVVNAARVSFEKEAEWDDELKKVLWGKDKNLINYLAEHDHWTPFAHTAITLRITAPIPIRTQCFKHKQGFVENEVSRRYVNSRPKLFCPQWKNKPEGSIKQGSGTVICCRDAVTLNREYKEATDIAIATYNTMILKGVCPEQARFVLPQGVLTTWYWTGSLAAYARMYKLRTSKDAQSEIRELATKIGVIIEELYPYSWKALTSLSM
jgi:thymidylate synthase (FAD)